MMKEYPNFTLKNVFALDDREDTFSHNPKNGIMIPVYSPSPDIKSISKGDTNLLKLEKWLIKNEVAEAENVQTLNKEKIF